MTYKDGKDAPASCATAPTIAHEVGASTNKTHMIIIVDLPAFSPKK